jgi:ATP-dependent Clp protease ATP-binding subunit ClpC
MFEHFTNHARKVISLEGIEAQRMHHDYLGTEHLLLALTREPEGHGHRALENLGVSHKEVRKAVEELVSGDQHHDAPDGFHQTPRAKHVMEMALAEARQLKSGDVGTEHLLLAILDEPEGVAMHALEKLDVHPDQVRKEIFDMLEQERQEVGRK